MKHKEFLLNKKDVLSKLGVIKNNRLLQGKFYFVIIMVWNCK